MHKWYVLNVITGKEIDTREVIQRDLPDIKAMVPERILKERYQGIWKTVKRILFPSYVFIYTTIDVTKYYALNHIPSVIKILGSSEPEPVPDNEISLIFDFMDDNGLLGISEAIVEGGKVKVIDGPLVGFEGKIVKIDARRYRAKVNISLMGELRIVELGINMIKESEG